MSAILLRPQHGNLFDKTGHLCVAAIKVSNYAETWQLDQ